MPQNYQKPQEYPLLQKSLNTLNSSNTTRYHPLLQRWPNSHPIPQIQSITHPRQLWLSDIWYLHSIGVF